MELWRIWLGMLTRDIKNAGTDSRLTLKISSQGVEKFNDMMLYHADETRTEDLGRQPDQERGEANLYDIRVGGRDIFADDLDNLSVSVGITGDDAWRPEHFFAWGEGADSQDIIPLAMETEISTKLSTDSGEGPDSMPLRLVGKGDSDMPINRLLMLMLTEGTSEKTGNFLVGTVPNPELGTDSPFEIIVTDEAGLVVSTEIKDTSQTDLNSGHANYYTAPVIRPFRMSDLRQNSITIRVKGRDNWYPRRFFLFGLDTAAGRPENIVPLVHLTYWPFGIMKADPSTGISSQVLPLLPYGKSRRPVIKPSAPNNQKVL